MNQSLFIEKTLLDEPCPSEAKWYPEILRYRLPRLPSSVYLVHPLFPVSL
jgi:hypothetical protein